ncbi:PA3496 family putative envelope integrity protein [Aquipseudomonas ullengensis]|uniref:Uncharacterized protein n=1 Tax=Aquipseudomonas ullengensis TaxID=2759166 RepID=A0A7W4LJ96_9GAMM|nr:hypothetical protein [Pseudomonas ullengensis]MBB2494202.1 hypothetical protein [Pseudomonas ullengensis]
MATYLDEPHSANKSRRQQEDLRRMQFRRAIEDYSERRRLSDEISNFPEQLAAGIMAAAPLAERRSARPMH